MNWKRYRVLVVGGAVALVLSSAAIVWIVKSNQRWRQFREEMDGLAGRQTSLVKGKPYPSQGNFGIMQKNKAILDEKLAAFQTNILSGQYETPPMQRSNFGDHVRALVPSLQRLAAASTLGGESGMLLRQPDFGLGAYLGGQLPETEQVPRLMVQMEGIRHLTTLLAREGVSELVVLERETFEVAKPGAGNTGVTDFAGLLGAPIPAPVAPGRPTPKPAFDLATHVDSLFDREKFTIKFRAYEDRVWAVLNAFAADPSQIQVNRVHLTNGNNRLWPSYLKPAPGMQERRAEAAAPRGTARLLDMLGEGGAGAEPAAKAGALPGLEAKRQLMTGGELMDVVVDLTLFRLKPIPDAGGTR